MNTANEQGHVPENAPVRPAVIWARVSTHDQAETSLPDQISRVKRKLEEAGYAVISTLSVDWSSMDLFSCPQFQELRAMIKNRDLEAIGVFDRDRLEAKGLQRLVFLSECRESGIELVICQGPPIMTGPEGQLVELALAIGKERSVMRARQGSRDGLAYRVKARNLPVSFHKIYGYKWEKTNPPRLVPGENWPNLKLILDMLVAGNSYDKVIAELKRLGIPSPSGQPVWNKHALYAIVRNPAYAGRYCALKKMAVEPKKRKGNTYGNSGVKLIPQKDWHPIPSIEVVDPPITWAQRELIFDQIAKHMKLSKRHAKNDYLLRGLISCGTHMGKNGEPRRYVGTPKYFAKTGKREFYYHCPVGRCPYPTLYGPEMDEQVKEAIANILTTQQEEFYKFLSSETTREEQIKHCQQEISACERRRERSLRLQASLEERHIDGEIDPEVYQRLKSKFNTEREGAETRKRELEGSLAQFGREREAAEAVGKLRDRFAHRLNELTVAEWRTLLSTLNVKIVVSPKEVPEGTHDLTWAIDLKEKYLPATSQKEVPLLPRLQVHPYSKPWIMSIGIPLEAKDRVGSIVLDRPGSG